MVKRKVLMSPMNGNLCVATPLYMRIEENELANLEGYSVSLTTRQEHPLAYAIELGLETIQLFNAEWVDKHLVYIDELND